ncbi:MAG: FGGY-family carbohydrate kinase [Candidatus Bathyarchaeia archaeon]
MGYLLGCDVGTTGCKTQIFDAEGKLVSQSYREYPLIYPRLRWVEADPEGHYWWAVRETFSEAIKRSGINPRDIEGISVSCTNCILAVDKNGMPLRNAIMQLDKRMVPQAEWIREHIGAKRIFEKTGNRISAGGTAAPTILWIKEEEPEVFEKTYKFLYPTGYIVQKLTGKFSIEYSRASFTILFEVGGRKTWCEEICEEMGIPIDKLPDIYAPWDVVGEVTEEAAKATGLAKGTPVVAGMADTPAAGLGTKAARPGDFFHVMGTVGRPSIIMDEPKFDDRFVNICHAVPGTWMSFGVMEGCGISVRWFRDQFGKLESILGNDIGKSPYELLDAEAERSPPGARGIIYLPYIAGERHTPIWDPNARSVFFGITASHTRADVFRSILEGLAFGLRHNMEIFESIGLRIREILISGGVSKSKVGMQIHADVTGKPVMNVNIPDSEPFGNAVLAGYGVGVYKDIPTAEDELIKIVSVVKPRAEYYELYSKLFEIYKDLYWHLKEDFEKLSRIEQVAK